jgi:transcriptional regulator with GAF, ATPase, and Fis domain
MAIEDAGLRSSIHSAMQELTSNFTTNIDVDKALTQVTALAVHLIDRADFADVMLVEDGGFRSVAPTALVVSELDEIQMRFDEGPCLEAATADSIIRSDDLDNEARWPKFTHAAVDAGVGSVLSFQLFIHRRGAGALNILSRDRHAFDAEGEAIGGMLATHAAIALTAANQQHQFQSALASRDLIGQAKGMIMKEFSVDAVAAFEMMVKLSQNSNTRIREIAQQVVHSLG